MRLKGTIIALLLMIPMVLVAQSQTSQIDSLRYEKYRKNIGFDLTVPDFETNRMDSKVMGTRLAGIITYLLDNYQQGVYDRRLSLIAHEQNDTLENVHFQIKNVKLVSAIKKGDEITILMNLKLEKNTAKVKQTEILFHFTDGVSESSQVNELFTYMSNYVQAREQLQ